MNSIIVSTAAGLFSASGLGLERLEQGPYALVVEGYDIASFALVSVICVAAALLYPWPGRHRVLGAAIILSSLAGFYPPSMAFGWDFLRLVGAVLGVVGGGLAVAWRPDADLPYRSIIPDPGEPMTEARTPSWGERAIHRILRQPGRLLIFALLIASGLAMIAVGLHFWGLRELFYNFHARYYGPPYDPAWIIFGIIAIITSILHVAQTRYRVAWGVVLIVVSATHSFLVAASYANRSVSLDDAILFGIPGVLAVLGTILSLTRGDPRAGYRGRRDRRPDETVWNDSP